MKSIETEHEYSDSAPVVDLDALDEAVDGDAEMRRAVLAMYLRQTAAALADLKRAIDARDAGKIYEIAHRSLGGSVLCGMTAIVDSLRELETAGREGDLRAAGAALVRASDSFAAIEKECGRITGDSTFFYA